MLAKAIATGFNSPFVTIPGSGFAQTFIGVDALIVRYLARKAKRLAAKWGGQCIVFIDEIDAVGMRRASLGSSMTRSTTGRYDDHCFYGPNGSLTPTGDLILETRGWRDRMFEQRASRPLSVPRLVHEVRRDRQPGPSREGCWAARAELALNQLLVTMDGIDNPPFWRRFWTNRLNNFLDATYVVPRRIGNMPLRWPAPRPAEQPDLLHRGDERAARGARPGAPAPGPHGPPRLVPDADEARPRGHLQPLPRQGPARPGARHRPGPRRARPDHQWLLPRNGRAGLLDGADPRPPRRPPEFTRDDIIEAMTTVESGTAVGVEYVPEETRAVAIHEAGHAAAAHVFLKGAESTRISIRMRAGSLGHHQALEKEERFSSWKHEEMAKLAWTLGALAAEQVFYGENATGVGGDLQSATGRSAWMVGVSGMGPEPSASSLNGDRSEARSGARRTRERMAKRFEAIGLQLMNRASGDFQHDSIAAVLGDPTKRRFAAQIIGQAYLNAYQLVLAEQGRVEKIADTLVVRKELYGDELIDLLNSVGLKEPVDRPGARRRRGRHCERAARAARPAGAGADRLAQRNSARPTSRSPRSSGPPSV